MRLRFVIALVAAAGCGETLAASNDPPAGVSADAGTDAAIDDAAGAVDACSTVNVTGDPKNCGRCGHDCLGGACTAGKCGAFSLVDWNLTDDRCGATDAMPCHSGTVSGVAVDDTYVYFGDHGGGSGDGNGGILRVRKDVTAPAKAESIAKGVSVRAFTLNASFLYWQTGKGVFRAPTSGGALLPLAANEDEAEHPQHPVVVGANLYYGTKVGVRRLPIDPDAGVISDFAFDPSGKGNIAALGATPGGELFAWAIHPSGDVRAFTGGVEKLVAVGQSGKVVTVEGSVVYWVNGNGDVFRADVTTTPIVPTPLGKTDVNPQTIVVAGDDLYVSTWGPNVNTAQGIAGSVYRLAKMPTTTGAAPELVFRSTVLATGLAVDERAIYVGAWFVPTVFRIAR